MPETITKETKKTEHWYALSIADVFKKIKSSKKGLTSAQVKIGRKQHGRNRLPSEKRLGSLAILFNQLKSPLVYILLIAGGISLALGHITDAGVIFFAVLINTVFGFAQENKANGSISKLKKIVKYKARVVRDGHEIQIDAEDLVPGDIVFVESGNKVPADCRILESKNLQVTEAALTGESVPSSKNNKILKIGTSLADRDNMLFMGTLVVRGKARAVVCKTGSQTEIGHIALLIKGADEVATPLQLKLNSFGKWLTLAVVIMSIAIFSIGLLSGKDPSEMFLIAVALAVAAIPEGLIVAVTIILTLGMQFMLKRKALVRKLVAAETLGSTSIICTDKTGTLTEGNMKVFKVITADKEYGVARKKDEEKIEKVRDLVSKVSVLCSSAVVENPEAALEEIKVIGAPTEKALLMAATEMGYSQNKLNTEYKKLDEIPFDSEKKYMATLHDHKSEGHRHIFIKGAPEMVFPFCNKVMIAGKYQKMSSDQLSYLKKKYESLTDKGLRLLAIAYKTGQSFENCEDELNDLVFLGFIALKDPLRPEAKETFKLCRKAGIRPVIITGDHRLTAKAIFRELGLKTKGNIVEGKELDKWSDEQLKSKVKNIDIYARVEPRHKLRIINAWQSRGEVVAMTGDGINDAPAIKAADIGIAFGNGSDVTKETADIILLDNNFSVIVAAVEQGRIIFDNIRKVILYLLSDSFSEIILIAGALLLGLPLPVIATQILWINLVADGLPNIAMTLEPGESEIMQDKPRKKDESIINKEMKILIFIIGIITDIILFILFIYLLKNMGIGNLDYIRTVVFMALGIDSLLYVFSVRSLRHSIFTKNPFSNKYLVGAVLISVLILLSSVYVPFLQSIFHTVPLSLNDWIIILSLGGIQIILVEIVKHHFIVKGNIKPEKNKPKDNITDKLTEATV
jgi:Ca2+-transporting ATPase